MKQYYIVWNEGRSEGFVTDDKDDAKSVTTGKPHRANGYLSQSTCGEAFGEAYEDQDLKVEKLDTDTTVRQSIVNHISALVKRRKPNATTEAIKRIGVMIGERKL